MSSLKMPKLANLGNYENLKLAVKQCYQTGQLLMGQKLVGNAKIEMRKIG